MEDTNQKTENIKNKPSVIENIGKTSLQIGEKLGKVVTEWFMGKPLSAEEKEHRRIKRERAKQLKLVQEEAQYIRDLELAKSGQYVPPEEPKKAKKKNDIGNIFSNLGKNNPLEGFNNTKSFGNQKNSNNIPLREPDFGLNGFAGSVNPMETKRRRGI